MKIVERDGVRRVEFEDKDAELKERFEAFLAEERPLRDAAQRALEEHTAARSRLGMAMGALEMYRAAVNEAFWGPVIAQVQSDCGIVEKPVMHCNVDTGELRIATGEEAQEHAAGVLTAMGIPVPGNSGGPENLQ